MTKRFQLVPKRCIVLDRRHARPHAPEQVRIHIVFSTNLFAQFFAESALDFGAFLGIQFLRGGDLGEYNAEPLVHYDSEFP